MKVLVSYDSKFGNTEKLALAMADALSPANNVRLQRVDDGALDLSAFDLVLIGGPTHAHGASAPLKAALSALPAKSTEGVRVATFDTRFRMTRILTGSAAGVAGKLLKDTGASVIEPSESFFVTRGANVTLEPGEIERAVAWAATLAGAAA